jgi:hypothetical protein
MFQHLFQSIVIFEDVDVIEGDVSAGEVFTGSGRVGAKILAENQYFFRSYHDGLQGGADLGSALIRIRLA